MSTGASSSSASSSFPDDPTSATTSSHSSFLSSFASLGLGYSISITVGLLLLVAALLISTYLCYRRRRIRAATTAVSSNPNLPIIIMVEDGSDEDDQISNQACSPIGLDPAAIRSYPKFPFLAKNGGETTCSICLCEYREAEMLRMLPDCRHYFHLMCIDAWLRLNASCPVCRTSPMPTPVSTPLSTPLSEVVPLSQYAADRRRR